MREAEFIQRVFREAAPIVLGGDRTAERKDTALGVYDVVTDSDVRTEEFVLSRIAEEFPGDSVISEETHPDAGEGERCWVLDPIDGTMNYTRGIPFFGMQAAFLEDGVPTMACIYLPVFDEMFVATEEGAYLNGRPIRPAAPRPLRECILSTGDFSRRSVEFRVGQANLLRPHGRPRPLPEQEVGLSAGDVLGGQGGRCLRQAAHEGEPPADALFIGSGAGRGGGEAVTGDSVRFQVTVHRGRRGTLLTGRSFPNHALVLVPS